MMGRDSSAVPGNRERPLTGSEATSSAWKVAWREVPDAEFYSVVISEQFI